MDDLTFGLFEILNIVLFMITYSILVEFAKRYDELQQRVNLIEIRHREEDLQNFVG